MSTLTRSEVRCAHLMSSGCRHVLSHRSTTSPCALTLLPIRSTPLSFPRSLGLTPFTTSYNAARTFSIRYRNDIVICGVTICRHASFLSLSPFESQSRSLLFGLVATEESHSAFLGSILQEVVQWGRLSAIKDCSRHRHRKTSTLSSSTNPPQNSTNSTTPDLVEREHEEEVNQVNLA